MKWHDQRLTFSNPMINQLNVVPAENVRDLWLPLDDLIHENAIIGEIRLGKFKKVKVYTSIPENIDATMATENRLFNGSYNWLYASQRMKIKYNCIFEVNKFPFDEKNCEFLMKINFPSQ